jgi:type I restriction enzyme, S subunit
VTFDDPVYIDGQIRSKIRKYTVKEGDICITIVGINIGDVGIVPRSLHNANLTENAAKVTNLIGCDPAYLNVYLQTSGIKEQMQLLSSGAAQDKLGLYKIKLLDIYLPDLPTQRKIAAILTAYDDLIEVNKRRIALLEKMAEELYREWFVRMRFPGHQDTRFVKGVPEGWEHLAINHFSKFKYGYTESAVMDDTLPKFLRVTDINKASYINWDSVPNCPIDDSNFDKLKLERHDIVIARMADPGRTAIMEDTIRAVFASYLIKVDYDRSQVTPYYLFYTLRMNAYLDYFQGANSGATRGSINAGLIGKTKILKPAYSIQVNFDEIVSPIRAQISSLLRSNQTLTKTRDLLLPRLISGKLSVENLDIQFPPSMQEAASAAEARPVASHA